VSVARSTAGFVRNSGILRRENINRLDEAYGLYRSHKKTSKPGADKAKKFRADYSHPDAKIPGIVRELEEATEGLADDQRRLIFGENAARLYSLA